MLYMFSVFFPQDVKGFPAIRNLCPIPSKTAQLPHHGKIIDGRIINDNCE